MKFAILGSGFGLYGYLPAIAGLGHTIVLPQRYRERFSARPELAQFERVVEWQPDELAALKRASVGVIAKRPQDQPQWVEQALALPNIEQLILEKPLAPTPQQSVALQRMLVESGKAFRIGYTFCDLPWLSLVRDFATATPDGHVSIGWHFMAHHFQHDVMNWKRSDAAGGGAIRFYGIQLIAALAQIGYRRTSQSSAVGQANDETTRWTATFSGEGLANCSVVVDCRSGLTTFDVIAKKSSGPESPLVQSENPFGGQSLTRSAADGLDARVGVIRNLVLSLETKTAALPWYADVLDLWQAVEDQTGISRGA